MNDDPSVDPTPPVQKIAAHHLVACLVGLAGLLAAVGYWAFR